MFDYSGKKAAIALGTFDGLHLGHMKVIASALGEKESGLYPLTLLFDVHPQSMFGGAPPEILQQIEKRIILEDLGFTLAEIAFRDIYTMSAEEFFNKILINELEVGAVCCGENYRFGSGGKAGTDELAALCKKNGVKLIVSQSVEIGGEPVSSTRIRQAIAGGDIRTANSLLGRAFYYRLPVVHGDARGRLMGAPTINQLFGSGFVVPAFGVYASAAEVDGQVFPGVTNIGIRPTFNGTELRSETHIIGFSGDLYGKNIKTALLDRLRGEQKFSSADELSRQIKADIGHSMLIFGEKGERDYV